MDDVRGILEKSGLDFAGIKGQGWGLPFDPGAGKKLAPEKVAFPGRMFTCAVTLGVITLLPDKPCHLSMASVLARYGLKWPRQLFGLMRKGRDDPSSPAGWKYPRAGRSATSMINDNVPWHGTYKGEGSSFNLGACWGFAILGTPEGAMSEHKLIPENNFYSANTVGAPFQMRIAPGKALPHGDSNPVAIYRVTIDNCSSSIILGRLTIQAGLFFSLSSKPVFLLCRSS